MGAVTLGNTRGCGLRQSSPFTEAICISKETKERPIRQPQLFIRGVCMCVCKVKLINNSFLSFLNTVMLLWFSECICLTKLTQAFYACRYYIRKRAVPTKPQPVFGCWVLRLGEHALSTLACWGSLSLVWSV